MKTTIRYMEVSHCPWNSRASIFRSLGISSLLVLGVGAYYFGVLPLTNLILLCCLFAIGLVVYFYRPSGPLLFVLWIVLILLTYGIAVYRPHGFMYPLVWHVPSLYDGGGSFQLYANISKGIGGGVLLFLLLGTFQAAKNNAIPLFKSVMISVTGVVSIILFAFLNGHIDVVVKFSSEFFYFFIVNLLFTVVPEEAFFRLLVQAQLSALFNNKMLGRVLTIILVGSIFGLVHVPLSHALFPLYLLAGLVYGVVFDLTNRFLMAVICHFSVNVLHILFFTYPLS